MTIQSVWTSPLLIGKGPNRPELLASVDRFDRGEPAEKKADEVVKEYLQRQAENLDRSKL